MGDKDISEKTPETDELEELYQYMQKKDKEKEYQNFFSKFSNLPRTTQKAIIINICIIVSSLIAFFYCTFILKYFRWELMLAVVALVFFLAVRTIAIRSAFSDLKFVIFTGEIVEAYTHGNKLFNDTHYIIKLRSDEGKEICVRYFDKEPLVFGQKLSVFMRPTAEISSSEYGLMVEEYIVIVSTQDITSKFELKNMKENSDALSIEEYLKK